MLLKKSAAKVRYSFALGVYRRVTQPRIFAFTGSLLLFSLAATACNEAGGSAAQANSTDDTLTAATASDAAQNQDKDASSPLGHTGSPAQPENDGPVSSSNQILAKTERQMASGPACEVKFAYAGYAPETVIWDEPCAKVTAEFMDQARLEELNRWERIDDYGRNAIASRTNGIVLYIGGTFAASVYPMDYNHLTTEITVAD